VSEKDAGKPKCGSHVVVLMDRKAIEGQRMEPILLLVSCTELHPSGSRLDLCANFCQINADLMGSILVWHIQERQMIITFPLQPGLLLG
jgi:hypothetical protein